MIIAIPVRLSLLAALTTISALLAAPSVNAQVDDTTQTVLPDISPREVEIRGQLEISFPSLQRQPLIGFNPPPRVPGIPEGYQPYLEDYKMLGADIPNPQLSQLALPDIQPVTDVDPVVGELEASAGRYLARVVRARLSTALNQRSTLYGKVDYEGSEGYSPEDDVDDLRNPHDGIRSVLGYQYAGPRTGVGVELRGLVNSYTLFGTNILQNGSLSTDIILPDRNGLNGIAEFWIRSASASTVGSEFRLGFSSSRYRTDLFDNTLTELPRFNQQEQRLFGRFDLDVPFSLGAFLVSAGGSSAGLNLSTPTAGIDDFSLFEFKNYALDARSGFRLDFSRALSLTLAGRFLGTSFVQATEQDNLSYLTADASLDLYPIAGLHFFVRNRPQLETNALWDVFEKNPYVLDQPTLQSTLMPLNAEAGFRFFKANIQVSADVGIMQSPNYLFFENAVDPPVTGYSYRRGVFDINYDDVEILQAQGAFSLSTANGLHFKVGLAVREATLTDSEGELPYFSPFVSENMISYSFSENRMLLQVLGTLYSSRYRMRTDEDKIPGYIDVDVLYTFMLHPGLGLVFRIDNIVGDPLEYWEHYSESPFTLSGGFRVLW